MEILEPMGPEEVRKKLSFYFTTPSSEEIGGVVRHWDMTTEDASDWIRLLELAFQKPDEIQDPQKYCLSIMRRHKNPTMAAIPWFHRKNSGASKSDPFRKPEEQRHLYDQPPEKTKERWGNGWEAWKKEVMEGKVEGWTVERLTKNWNLKLPEKPKAFEDIPF